MKTQIHLDSVERGRALDRFIRFHLSKSLSAHRSSIGRIRVLVRDINAQKGGIDKECKIIIDGPTTKTLVVREISETSGKAFRLALKRMLSVIRKRMSRRVKGIRSQKRAEPIFLPA